MAKQCRRDSSRHLSISSIDFHNTSLVPIICRLVIFVFELMVTVTESTRCTLLIKQGASWPRLVVGTAVGTWFEQMPSWFSPHQLHYDDSTPSHGHSSPRSRVYHSTSHHITYRVMEVIMTATTLANTTSQLAMLGCFKICYCITLHPGTLHPPIRCEALRSCKTNHSHSQSWSRS